MSATVRDLGLPVHDDTPWLARAGQFLPQWVYGGLLIASALAAAATLAVDNDKCVTQLGAGAAIAAALSALGFVLHGRPRILRRQWSDLSWDESLKPLIDANIIDYESTAEGFWYIPSRRHKKGKFPAVRFTKRLAVGKAWTEWDVAYDVSDKGEITVLVDLKRTDLDDGEEIRLLVT